jgi:single-strand DNA-binding protein
MLNMNQVTIAGNLTRDAELKTGTSGKVFATGTVAINDTRDRSKVDYVDFIVFAETAENLAKITQKGNNVLLTGRLSVRSYTDKDGNKRKSTEVIAETFQAITRKPKADAAAPAETVAAGAGLEDEIL